MTSDRFEIHQCSNPQCDLRFPLDPHTHAGLYCPRCGSPTKSVMGAGQQFFPAAPEKHSQRVLSCLLDNIRSALNVGSAFRTANGAGLAHIYLCGITPTPENSDRIAKTALGADISTPWSYHPNALRLADQLKSSATRLVALECTPKAISLFDFVISPTDLRPLTLVVGGELAGVDPGLLDLCEDTLFIPMYGTKGSLNASVALGIALYWLIH